MKLKFTALLSFGILFAAQAQVFVEDTLKTQKIQYTPVTFKFGGLTRFDGLRGSEDITSGLLGAEIALAQRMSVNLGAEMPYGIEFDGQLFLEGRYYLNAPSAVDRLNHFNGLYLSPTFYYSGNIKKQDYIAFDDLRFRYSGRVYENNYGLGVKLGKQVYGLIDYGLFLGYERSLEKVQNLDNAHFQARIGNYPVFQSFVRLHIPVWNELLYSELYHASIPAENPKHFLKLGLNNLISLSKKGLYFNPNIGFEQAFGKLFSVNLNTLLEVARFHEFDSFSDSVPVFSEQKFLNQTISFSTQAQFRAYLLQLGRKHKFFNENFHLEGLYAAAQIAYHTSSQEAKRVYWEYEKEDSADFGLGLGFQKMLNKQYLIDLSLGRRIGHFGGRKNRSLFPFYGGISVYWVPRNL